MKITNEQGQTLILAPVDPESVPPSFVWNLTDILGWLNTIEAEIATPYHSEDIDSIQERILSLANHFSASSQVCASATWYLKAARAYQYELIAKAIKGKELPSDFAGITSATNIKIYIADRCADLEALKVRADRMNASITHSIDALRTVISKAKTEMQINNIPV